MNTSITNSNRLRNTGLKRSMIGATAIGSMGASLMTANAAIVYSGPRNLSTSSLIGDEEQWDEQPVNLDGVGADEFALTSYYSKGEDSHITRQLSPGFDVLSSHSGVTHGPALRLAAGDTVSAASTFNDPFYVGSFSGWGSQWDPGTEGYFGYRFNPTGAQDLFGWGRMAISSDGKVMTLVDWAYESTGAPIQAGVVPEPATGLLLLASMLFTVLWRRRKLAWWNRRTRARLT